MASEKAPVKATGGGGFLFADRFASLFFAQMLTGALPLGSEHGTLTKIEFENRDRGWLLDDLLLSLEASAGQSFCAISLRSNDQVTQSGFPKDFVRAVWEQTKGSSPFRPDRDLLALGTARVATGVKAAWDQLVLQAIETDPDRLVLRLKREGQSSEIQRDLFSSLHCPPDIGPEDPLATASLIRTVRLLVRDFETEPSADESAAIALCREALRSGDTVVAISLWRELQSIAEAARTAGASIDLQTLLAKIRARFELKHHPDYEADWRTLRQVSAASIAGVRSEIGAGIFVPRTALEKELQEKTTANQIIALRGESGCGKSALTANALRSADDAHGIIWLDKTQADHPNQIALARALELRHNLPDLLATSSHTSGYIVLDALERFSAQGLRRAVELIKAASAVPGTAWKVVMTFPSYFQDQLFRELFTAGVQLRTIASIDVGLSSPLDLASAVGPVAPGVAALLLRRELQGILCNLKVLDWVLAEDALRTNAQQQSFVGETDVIEWIWNRWIGESADRHARGELLISIGEHEGESLASYVTTAQIGDDKRRTIGELEQDRLLRVRQGNITFSHDLLGDWARFQALRSAGANAIDKTIQVVSFPRWQRAVRLYGQFLLEHEDGAERWKQALTSFQGEASENVLAGDCLLDALIFATNAKALLEQVWPHLIAGDGHLLGRFLKRFLFIATVPDPRIQEIDCRDDIDWFLARMRIPYIWYWYAPLRVFERHHTDLCKLALVLAAEVCELWLRTIPPEWGGRPEAAKIALKLAREAQGRWVEAGPFSDTAYQRVYEALCQAAPDFPDEVSQLALELCERRTQSPEITVRAKAYREKQRAEEERIRNIPPEVLERRRALPPPIGLGLHQGPQRPAAPDGPARRVSEAFQLAIFNSAALIPLAQVRPEVAREVLLAVCIDEPKSADYHDTLLDRDFGTTTWQGGYPPMYFRGPFLRLLRTQPKEGLDTIVRLVNYATGRWAEHFLSGAPDDLDPDYYSLELALLQGQVRWTGNINVFAWYRDIMIGSESVVSALMALEKWLYDEIDQGRSIETWIEQIVQTSSSLAFAGLLIAVGLRNQALLSGPLRFLLATWPFYHWQLQQALRDDSWRIGLTSWARSGKQIFNQVVAWHSMPHRKKLLRDTAIELFIGQKSMREFLTAQREAWAKELESHPNEDLELLVARFDAKNYRGTELEGGHIMFEFQWPEHLRERTTAKAEAAQKGAAAIAFPHRCRRILSGEDTLTPEEFWTQFEALHTWNDTDGADYTIKRSTIMAAGITVLATVYPEWLNAEPDRRIWCLEALKELAAEEPNPEYSPYTVMDNSTESFLAEAALAFIPEVGETWLRELVAKGVMGFYYSSTGTVLQQAFRLRDRLQEDFVRTLNLMICWAAVRRVRRHKARTPEDLPVAPHGAEGRLLRAYVTKRLSSSLLPLERVAEIARRNVTRVDARDRSFRGEFRKRPRERRRDHEVYRNDLYLDTEILSRGFGFLGNLSLAHDATDRADLIRCHKAVLDFFLQTMPRLENQEEEVEGTPYEFDRWVLALTAGLIPQLSSIEEARSFWQPIMDIGPGARYWMEDFFRHWFISGRQASPTLDVFAGHWREMIAYSLDSPVWTPGASYKSYLLEECSIEVMGFGFALDITSAEEFSLVISPLAPLVQRWAERWLDRPRAARQFAHFLSRPAGRKLLPAGIIWLNRAVQKYAEYEWRERDLDQALAGALQTCWRHANAEVASNTDLRRHFLQLLNTLCNRLSADALALQAQVTQFIPNPVER